MERRPAPAAGPDGPASDDQNTVTGAESDPSGAPLVRMKSLWLHGGGLAGDTWSPLIASLPQALAPDLPGHGQAPDLQQPRVEAYADVLQQRVQPGAVLIGHSLGGMVALELAVRAQLSPAALVLIEAVPTVRDRLSGRLSAALAVQLTRILPKSVLVWSAGLGQTDTTRVELRRHLGRMDSARIASVLDAAAHYDGRPHLCQVDVPTLVIVGQKNKATHRGAKLMAETIAGAELQTLPGGHMLHTDNPGGLRCAINGFLRRRLPPADLA
ncbi:alpha/beta hydrolase [uncultured Roseobacter sp.]|uniref:alpha/beta fold hydrolase n=1 Tax=uncultured Roseobacter sp. TaxID=114847 RepID=UPI002629CDF7|nr:alpha/beta hydrolase [uncultured Roseobacter sp.]